MVKCTNKPITITGAQLRGYARNNELKILDSSNDMTKKNSYTCAFNGKEVKIDITLFDNDEHAD